MMRPRLSIAQPGCGSAWLSLRLAFIPPAFATPTREKLIVLMMKAQRSHNEGLMFEGPDVRMHDVRISTCPNVYE